jgi:UDP-glucose 4-epimerase
MKILVTGGAGFIGSHVVDAYVQEGHQVTALDNLSQGVRDNVNPRAKFVNMDICSLDLADFFEQSQFDVVNHHAALTSVRQSTEQSQSYANTNLMGSLNLLEASVRAGVKKFIFASTGGCVYGQQECSLIDEDCRTRPLDPYGISKASLELYLPFYFDLHKLRYSVLRYANIYGPRQASKLPLYMRSGVVSIFISEMLEGQTVVINGDGSQTRDFLYVEDAARANVRLLGQGDQQIFNFGRGQGLTVNQIFNQLKEIIGYSLKPTYLASRMGEVQSNVLDITKARNVLAWEPLVGFEHGLTLTVDYFKSLTRQPSIPPSFELGALQVGGGIDA